MVWEGRKGSKARYQYRSERRGKKVVKIYLGASSNPAVQLMGRHADLNRAQSIANRQAEILLEDTERERKILQFHLQVYVIVAACTPRLLGSHDKTCTKNTKLVFDMADAPTRGEFLALVARSDRGLEKAQKELRELFDKFPSVWQAAGDLGHLVEAELIALASKGAFSQQETLARHLQAERRRLTRVADDALESLLVQRVLVSWLDVQICQVMAHQMQSSPGAKAGQTKLDAAQRRHLEAIEALDRYQRAAADGQRNYTASPSL